MSWTSNERAVREFGAMLANPRVRAELQARRLLRRPTFCADAEDSALDVLTAATARGLAAVIMIRMSERNFEILAQVKGAPHMAMPIPDEMTMREYLGHLARHHESLQSFQNEGELVSA